MADLRSTLERVAERGEARGAHQVLADARHRSELSSRVATSPRPRRRWLIPVIVATTCVATLMFVRTRSDSGQHVATARPPSSADAVRAGSLTDSLEWSAGGQLVRADPTSGRQETIASIGGSCRQNCPVVLLGSDIFVAGDRVLRVDPAGTVTDLGPGQAIIPTPSRTAMYVVDSVESSSPTSTTTILHALLASGAPAGGPWTLPDGYVLSSARTATPRGLLVQTNENAVDHTLAVWDPQSGAIDVLGPSRFVIDVFTPPNSDVTSTVVAYTKAGCAGTGCDIALLDLATRRTIDVASPLGASGFYGGGSFSADGRYLAAFAATSPGTSNPGVRLAIIDTAAGTATAISGSDVAVGEPVGYATWSPSSDWVFVAGASGPVKAHHLGTNDAVELPVPGSYGFVAIGQDAANPGPEQPSTTATTLRRATACPGSVPRRTIDPGEAIADALPYIDNAVTSPSTAQGALSDHESELLQRYHAVSIEVGPGFGRAWRGQNGGQYEVVDVDDYGLIVHLQAESDCPSPPGLYTSVSNVPLFFVVDR